MGPFVGAQQFSDDAVTAPVNIKAAAGFIFLLNLINTTDADAYLQVFDKPAADVVLGTTVPKFFLRLPASSSLLLPMQAMPIDLTKGTGMSIAGTTTSTGASTAAISVSAFYQ